MRLGRIPWINCYPVYGAIDRGLVKVPAELVSGTASELNDLLAAGALQVSAVSAVEYARNAAMYHLLPDLAITCALLALAGLFAAALTWRRARRADIRQIVREEIRRSAAVYAPDPSPDAVAPDISSPTRHG